MRNIVGLLIFTMFFAGCVSWTAIKPTELPKLNTSQEVFADQQNGQVRLIRVTQLETPDGRLTEIQGQTDARVRLKDGTSMLFEHPLKSTIENQAITIMSGNSPKTTIPLDRIEGIEVAHPLRGEASGILSFIGFLLSVAVLVGLVVAG